jgi:hypothetical protein
VDPQTGFAAVAGADFSESFIPDGDGPGKYITRDK